MSDFPLGRRNLRLGRNRPIAKGPRLSLKNYLLKSLPSPPATVNYRGAAFRALSQMYGNDSLGDCVIAGIAHLAGVFTANAGANQLILTPPQIVSLYSAIGGYVPGDPSTDQGCDEVTALNYWQQNGAPIGSHKIAGWLQVDAQNPTEYRTALWLFENLFFGVELPDAYVNPFPSASNFTWGMAGQPNPNNGHAFVGVGYAPRGIVIGTWGMAGVMTDAAVQYYAGNSQGGALYAVLSADSINKAKKKAPNGFDFTQLIADFDAIGGTV